MKKKSITLNVNFRGSRSKKSFLTNAPSTRFILFRCPSIFFDLFSYSLLPFVLCLYEWINNQTKSGISNKKYRKQWNHLKKKTVSKSTNEAFEKTSNLVMT